MEVMKSYYKTMDWHKRQSAAEEEVPSEEVESDDNMGGAINMLYINQKLERGLARIWQDVQQKVKLFLIATDLLIDIGQEFCGSGSEGLHESIRQQSLKYFKNYHNSRMEELRMFMENEGWRICPVKSNFTHLNLQEFRFLRPSISSKENQPLDSPSSPTLGSVRGFF
ncbi:putative coiled-coil domain-containing protein, partial [Apostichopus japonicus]